MIYKTIYDIQPLQFNWNWLIPLGIIIVGFFLRKLLIFLDKKKAEYLNTAPSKTKRIFLNIFFSIYMLLGLFCLIVFGNAQIGAYYNTKSIIENEEFSLFEGNITDYGCTKIDENNFMESFYAGDEFFFTQTKKNEKNYYTVSNRLEIAKNMESQFRLTYYRFEGSNRIIKIECKNN